jgi:hypothetical protein
MQLRRIRHFLCIDLGTEAGTRCYCSLIITRKMSRVDLQLGI